MKKFSLISRLPTVIVPEAYKKFLEPYNDDAEVIFTSADVVPEIPLFISENYGVDNPIFSISSEQPK